MKPLSLAALLPVVILVSAPRAPAQDPMEVPAPAAQLSKFEPFIGQWEVKGTMRMEPGAPELPWTAQESLHWALGGHFVQQLLIIDFGDVMPNLVMSGFMGWDNETQRYVQYGASNQGEVARMEPQFLDDNTMVVARTGFAEGQFMVERSVLKMGEGTYTFQIDMALGDGPFFTTVEGTGTRVGPGSAAVAVGASMSLAPPAAEMAALEKWVGDFDFTGTMIPAPGAPEMEITGSESIRMIMGGSVMTNTVSGEALPGAPPYEAVGYAAWNPVDQCYDMITADNMGMSGKAQMRDMGNGVFVVTGASVMYGQPTVNRMVLTCDAQGVPASAEAHSISGASAPQLVFSGKYSKN